MVLPKENGHSPAIFLTVAYGPRRTVEQAPDGVWLSRFDWQGHLIARTRLLGHPIRITGVLASTKDDRAPFGTLFSYSIVYGRRGKLFRGSICEFVDGLTNHHTKHLPHPRHDARNHRRNRREGALRVLVAALLQAKLVPNDGQG